MEKTLNITNSSRKAGSYLRKDLKGDILYGSYRYKQLNISFAKASGAPTTVTDHFARQLVSRGYISPVQQQLCEETLRSRFLTREQVEGYDECSVEEIYALAQAVRRDTLGKEAVCKAQLDAATQPLDFSPVGIDQRQQKDEALANCAAAIFALCDTGLTSLMRQDLEKARAQGKKIYILANPEAGYDLPDRQTLEKLLPTEGAQFLPADFSGIAYDEALQRSIDQALLLVYGEDGLLYCRDLLLDAVVYAAPRGYYAQGVTNQLGAIAPCVVFVPRNFDITHWVRLTERTRLSYWQLAKLQTAYGDGIYRCTVPQLYEKYPQHFVDVYQNGPDFVPGPVTVEAGPEVFENFDTLREKAIGKYLDRFPNLQYYCAYFDQDLNPRPMGNDSSQKQPGILVHGVRITKAQAAQVIRCQQGKRMRQLFEPSQTGVVSNFLFFMTARLAALYNELRKDRPYEQADVASGHLDYMLAYQEGKRLETFPLFRKTCIAMKENGEFIFFNFRLGGGSIQVGQHTIRWEADQVDGGDTHAPVQVFTPYLSLPHKDADRDTYRLPVGEGRINLVILQDRICCLRKGDVILPSVGVVVSLTEAAAAPILQGLPYLEDGYYDVSDLELTVKLDPPTQVDAATWAQVRWAYGGGLSLILDGVGLGDGDHMDSWFEADGWQSPLSRQTQESTLHQLVKHPRTAIGTLAGGDLVILVFSGRTWRSAGANYLEMCQIARKLFGDVSYLMNVDGGGSAMLGMVTEGNFMELSYPSTSGGSCAGMARTLHTILYIPAEE